MRRGFLALGLAVTIPFPAQACELALALAVDVSGSVDPVEYNIQMQGLANALRDSVVSEALVRAEAAVILIQWTGNSRQEVSVPWTRLRSFEDVQALAKRVETAPRRWRNFSTAIGEALRFTLEQFDTAPDCKRRVIDVSGDGPSNEGAEPRAMHPALQVAGITVNALAIEEDADDLTGYFWENLIRGEGAFVVTANRFEDYPAQIRRKLLRETTKQLACSGRRC
jgi:Ca-activated chloride channel family protein